MLTDALLAAGETESQALLRELVEELGDGVKGKMGAALAVGKDGPVEVSSYFVEIDGDIKPNPGVSLHKLRPLCCSKFKLTRMSCFLAVDCQVG